MPVYEYMCDDCGPFTAIRPMSECDLPHACPDCSGEAPRVLLTAPYCATMPSDRRRAHATNERSRSAPKSSAEYKASHPSGCSCCSGKSSRFVARGKGGSKSFPASRPWMISH